MGQYDNYDNAYQIKAAEKALVKLKKKRKPDTFAIALAQKDLENAKLFNSCQIFGSVGFFSSAYNPNQMIMFSDDNQVVWFGGKIIPYQDIKNAMFLKHNIQKSYTTTKKKGTVSRAIIGGMVAGEVGAIVGAASAGSESTTDTTTVFKDFFYEVDTKDGQGFQIEFPGTGMFDNKISKEWEKLDQKMHMIIEKYNISDNNS
ncbi:MAG: hypothetical protein ACOX78_04920 [Lachnospiraceae bacterium]|jgi:hypothetical protein